MKKTTPYDRFSNYLNNIDLDVPKVVISASALYLSFIIMHTFWDGDPKAEAYIMELSTKILTLAIAVIGLILLFRRVDNQQKQIDSQTKQRIDERLSQAITLLGNDSQSTRIGAIYLLYKLAFNELNYRNDIIELLLLHVQFHHVIPV